MKKKFSLRTTQIASWLPAMVPALLIAASSCGSPDPANGPLPQTGPEVIWELTWELETGGFNALSATQDGSVIAAGGFPVVLLIDAESGELDMR